MHIVRTAIPKTVLILLFLAWMIPGLIGRDLWKADEPYSFGIVNHIVRTGDWVVPTLGGEPFMEKPPGLYLTAAFFVRLASPLLEPPDAARLAVGFFMACTVIFLAVASRELQGKGYGAITAVVFLGCMGLLITAHKIITDVAMLTGFAVGFYGLVLGRRRPVLGGLWLGTGTGIGFLSKGLLAPGILGVIALILPVISAEWRKKTYLHTLLAAFAAALPWLIVWPLALYLRSPELFMQWLWDQNLARFFGYTALVGRKFSSFSYFAILPWFAMPALPLALWTVWANRKSWRTPPSSILFPLTAFLVMFAVLSFSSSIRPIYALPMLLPLSLLAAPAFDAMGERTKTVLNVFSMTFFSLAALALWIGWLAMVTGHPAKLADRLQEFQPDYSPSLNLMLLLIALAYTCIFVFAVVRFTRARCYPIMNWTLGTTLAWALLMTIWLPWLDAGSGYRPIFTSLRDALPARHGIIASFGLGESERALAEYYAGVKTRRIEVNNDMNGVDLFIIETGAFPLEPPKGISWRLLWKRSRPENGVPKETFRLYERVKGKGYSVPKTGKKS